MEDLKMNKKVLFTLGCLLLTGMIFVTSCSNGKTINPVEPNTDTYEAAGFNKIRTAVYKGQYDEVTVTYRGRRLKHIRHTAFRQTHIKYVDTKSRPRRTYPDPPTTAHRDLTCAERPGYILTIGFTAGQISYLVEKRPGRRDIFCHYLDSYYKIYDGTYTHRITTYPRR
jgi:hypothetical protein